ncbi:hypothetical protein [Shewanella baltica]|uniref:hypothetical protein n=1 Tax=Shewanella baltica TaxID=62322 RepID=UPI0039AF040C
MKFDDDVLELFPRDLQLEKEIDRKNALHYLQFESLNLFLDVLSELISDHNENMDRYSKGKVYDFLRLRHLRLEGCNYNIDIYNNVEGNYINEFRNYIVNIRQIAGVKSISRNELIVHVLNVIKKCVLECGNNSQYIIEVINEELSKFQHLHYSVNNASENLYLFLHNYKYCISLINNPVDFKLPARHWLTSLIVTRDASDLFLKIEKSNNLDVISYKSNSNLFRTIHVSTPLDSCINKVERILQTLKKTSEHNTLNEKLLDVRNRINGILSASPRYPKKVDQLHLEDIKLLRRKFISIIELVVDDSSLHKSVLIELKFIVSILSSTYNYIVSNLELEHKISFSLSEIKKNNTLYIVSKNNKKNQEFSFGEENLTSILASNLRCLYKEYSNISVNCEAMVGNGRSDVRISMGNKTFGLIEAKLLNPNSNIETETRNAIDQLFSRYSENENIEGDADISLYLIIFSYDKNFRKLAKSIKNSIYVYSQQNRLEYEKISSTENGVLFSYKEKRNEFDFIDKVRTINLIVCNMEIDYKSSSKQRTSNKTFEP